MQLELSALKTLSEADENVLHSILYNCTEQKQTKNSKDAASVIASAAWGGAPVAPMPREFKPNQTPAKTEFPPPVPPSVNAGRSTTCLLYTSGISAALPGCQDLVRFFALLRIKPHAPLLVRAPVNSFEFQPCLLYTSRCV